MEPYPDQFWFPQFPELKAGEQVVVEGPNGERHSLLILEVHPTYPDSYPDSPKPDGVALRGLAVRLS